MVGPRIMSGSTPPPRPQQKPGEMEDMEKRAAGMFPRLDALFKNEDMQWFLETFVKPRVDQEHARALDIKKSSEFRNEAAFMHAMGKEILEMLAEKRIYYAGQAKIPLTI